VTKDLREYARSTQARLVLGFILLVFLVGVGLIYLFYGTGPALAGLGCLLAVMVPVGLIALFLWITDEMIKRRG
jgi:hypothetical protein